MTFHVVISAHSYSREMDMRVNKMIRDMLGNQSGEFVCGYRGSSAWWPIEAVFLEFLASGPGQNSDP